jgi:hypothetical protein
VDTERAEPIAQSAPVCPTSVTKKTAQVNSVCLTDALSSQTLQY